MRRDPQTGKFVSTGSSGGFDRRADIAWSLASSVPTADLTTGLEADIVDGEGTIAIDFDDLLDQDEIFHLLELVYDVYVVHNEGTDAAAGVTILEYGIADDVGVGHPYGRTGIEFVGGDPDSEEGRIDFASGVADDNATWLTAGAVIQQLAQEDTTNGTGSGPSHGHNHEALQFPEGWATFDANDEMTVPHQIQSRGTDIQINAGFRGVARGIVVDDDC